MNSLDVRKLVLLVKYAVVEIILMMTQRALILIPHPVSRQHPEPVDKFPFIDVLSAALFLFPSKHVEGQTNSYKTELNASLFQEGCRQGAKRAVRECNVINEHGCSVRIGFSTQDASSPRNTILKLRLLGVFLFVLLFFFYNKVNNYWICGNQVHIGTSQYPGGKVTVKAADVSLGQTQHNPSRPYYFLGLWADICNYYFSHPDGSFKTLPRCTICACLGDVWWPVVWYCSYSDAGKSFCLPLHDDSWQSHSHAKTALARVYLKYSLIDETHVWKSKAARSSAPTVRQHWQQSPVQPPSRVRLMGWSPSTPAAQNIQEIFL